MPEIHKLKLIKGLLPKLALLSMLTSAGISWNSNVLWAPQWVQAGSSVTSDVGQVKKSGSPLQEYLRQGNKEQSQDHIQVIV